MRVRAFIEPVSFSLGTVEGDLDAYCGESAWWAGPHMTVGVIYWFKLEFKPIGMGSIYAHGALAIIMFVCGCGPFGLENGMAANS